MALKEKPSKAANSERIYSMGLLGSKKEWILGVFDDDSSSS